MAGSRWLERRAAAGRHYDATSGRRRREEAVRERTSTVLRPAGDARGVACFEVGYSCCMRARARQSYWPCAEKRGDDPEGAVTLYRSNAHLDLVPDIANARSRPRRLLGLIVLRPRAYLTS
jgi:hypothetical protein